MEKREMKKEVRKPTPLTEAVKVNRDELIRSAEKFKREYPQTMEMLAK